MLRGVDDCIRFRKISIKAHEIKKTDPIGLGRPGNPLVPLMARNVFKVYNKLLPPASEGYEKVMFLQMSVHRTRRGVVPICPVREAGPG